MKPARKTPTNPSVIPEAAKDKADITRNPGERYLKRPSPLEKKDERGQANFQAPCGYVNEIELLNFHGSHQT